MRLNDPGYFCGGGRCRSRQPDNWRKLGVSARQRPMREQGSGQSADEIKDSYQYSGRTSMLKIFDLIGKVSRSAQRVFETKLDSL